MPYIQGANRRYELRTGALPETVGELDYVLTIHVLRYLSHQMISFTTLNGIVGTLDNVKDEFRRRILHPYEDLKRAENGDVYPDS